MKGKYFLVTVLCIMCAFLLSAGCVSVNTDVSPSNSDADYPSYSEGDYEWVEEDIKYDIEGSYDEPDGVTLVYRIKFNAGNGADGILFYQETLKDQVGVMSMTLPGSITVSGTDRKIETSLGDTYYLSDSNVLTTPEGYKVSMKSVK